MMSFFFTYICYCALIDQNYDREEKNAAQLARQQKRYRLIDADDEDDEPSVVKHAKSDTHKKHFRKKTGVEESEDDEVCICFKTLRNSVHFLLVFYILHNVSCLGLTRYCIAD